MSTYFRHHHLFFLSRSSQVVVSRTADCCMAFSHYCFWKKRPCHKKEPNKKLSLRFPEEEQINRERLHLHQIYGRKMWTNIPDTLAQIRNISWPSVPVSYHWRTGTTLHIFFFCCVYILVRLFLLGGTGVSLLPSTAGNVITLPSRGCHVQQQQ